MNHHFENRYKTQLCRTATHIYLLPHPALRPYVAHYTLCPRSGGYTADVPGSLCLIPDASGCFVLTLCPDEPDMRMYGPSTATVSVSGGLAATPPMFFVEFRPGGLFALTGLPQHGLRDGVWQMDDTVPALAARLRVLALTAPDLDEFIRSADEALCTQVRAGTPVAPMLNYLLRSRAPRPVDALAAETTYSPRHLSRLFAEGVGMGCKSFLRILRINEAVRRMGAGAPSLTTLAQELGYYDQAHFIHDFKSICGISPGEYRASLSDFYNEPLKF